jgi:hypothetical protein
MSNLRSGYKSDCQLYDQRCFTRFDTTVLDGYRRCMRSSRTARAVFREGMQINDQTAVGSCLYLRHFAHSHLDSSIDAELRNAANLVGFDKVILPFLRGLIKQWAPFQINELTTLT